MPRQRPDRRLGDSPWAGDLAPAGSRGLPWGLAAKSWRQPALPNQIQSDNLLLVKRLSVTDVARNFSAVLDDLERDQEEVVLVRNQRQIARLVPEASQQDALSVFGDLYRTLDDETAEALSAAIASHRKSRRGRVSELRDPWAG
jgi:antitoxin (DNA-binding transcriptional repressor) of toxin-antitoxin stability system